MSKYPKLVKKHCSIICTRKLSYLHFIKKLITKPVTGWQYNIGWLAQILAVNKSACNGYMSDSDLNIF